MDIGKIGNWIAARLKERSTYVGLTFAATTLGINLSPEWSETIATIGGALASVILILVKDKLPPVIKTTTSRK